MSYHYSRVLLEIVAMHDSVSADSTSTEADRGGRLLYTFVRLVGDRSKRQVTHTWPGVTTPLKVVRLMH